MRMGGTPSCRKARMFDLVFWLPVMAGGTLVGASSGLLGTFIVGMRIPFLGVCVAHAALAGAVFGSLCGLEGQALLLPALGGSTCSSRRQRDVEFPVFRHDGAGVPRHRTARHPGPE